MELLSFVPENNDCDFQRVERMRRRMTDRVSSICPQRAEIVTQVYQQTEGQPYILRRAKALAAILERMTIYIEKDSLIIGNHASTNFAAPVFPEYSYNWVIAELDSFESRKGDSFNITEETKNRLRALEEYWDGNTHNDEVLATLPEILKLAEKTGTIYGGGIPMTGDGHIIPNHELLLRIGFSGIADIARSHLKQDDLLTQEQKDFYTSVIIVMEGVVFFFRRFSILAAEMQNKENDPIRRRELYDIAIVFSHLMNGGARSFHEAVEIVYVTHLITMLESNGHSFSFGRFDQFMYPYYKKDLDAGLISREKALELITHFFIMTNSLNKIRPWKHTHFSSGFPLYSNLMVGGMKSDGTDGTNDLSYFCLEAMNICRMPEPNLSVRYCDKTPISLIRDAARMIRKGFGMPSIFCDEVVIPAMLELKLDVETARDYSSMGCVEIAIPGKWGHRATGMTHINLAKVFELVLNNGCDPKTGIQLLSLNGQKGRKITYSNYAELWEAWKRTLKFFTNLAVEYDSVCDRSLEHHDADAFASSVVDFCLDRGKTLKSGGAQYDYISHSVIGPSVVADSLAAVKDLVFDKEVFSLDKLIEALDNNFEGLQGAQIRKQCRLAPKFGNDDDYVDSIAEQVYHSYLDLLPEFKNIRYGRGPIGCGYTMSTSNITSYIPNGFDVGATPDGRLAGKPLNEGASPCIGADREGPTAVINSISKLPNDHMAGGQLLNMRFSPGSLEGEQNLEKFISFIRAGRYKKVFHIQFNVVDSKTLLAAQKNPQDYPDLMVRVAGYCALFTTLVPQAQDAIIERYEHSLT